MEGSASGLPEQGGRSNKKMLAIAVVVILLVVAIAGAVLLTNNTKKTKDLVVATISGNQESLDPAVDYETVGGEVLQNVYETLMFYNGTHTDVLDPILCTEVPTKDNGLVTDNGHVYTYNLRQNVKFHDNTPMDASDVVFSFKRMLMINEGPAWMVGEMLIGPSYYDYLVGGYLPDGAFNTSTGVPADVIAQHIWAKSQYSVQFNLTVPFPAWNNIITFNVASIISEDFVNNHGGMTKAGADYMSANTCGTGAFYLAESVADSHFLLKKWNDYWRTPAKLDSVKIMQVPDDNTRILMIKKGEADIASVPRSMRSAVDGADGIRIGEGNVSFSVEFFGFNQVYNNTGSSALTNIPSDFFQNVNVRLAFAHAFDYNKYLDTQYNGSGIQPNGAIPKGMFGYDSTVPLYDYDLAKVKSYLENATFTKDGTQTNWLVEGFSLELFYNKGNSVRQTASELFKKGLESTSDKIHITVTELEWSEYLAMQKAKKLAFMILGWAPDYADPQDYVQPFLYSTGYYGSRYIVGNDTLDAMIDAAAIEQNKDARISAYKNISMFAYNQCLYLWTVQASNFHVERTWVVGYNYNAMYSQFYYYPMDKNV